MAEEAVKITKNSMTFLATVRWQKRVKECRFIYKILIFENYNLSLKNPWKVLGIRSYLFENLSQKEGSGKF